MTDSSHMATYYRPTFYTLAPDNTVMPATFEVWARWMERHRAQRQVGRADVYRMQITTYFLGKNVCTTDPARIELFETIISQDAHNQVVERYATYVEAHAGHLRWVAWAHTPNDAREEHPDATAYPIDRPHPPSGRP